MHKNINRMPEVDSIVRLHRNQHFYKKMLNGRNRIFRVIQYISKEYKYLKKKNNIPDYLINEMIVKIEDINTKEIFYPAVKNLVLLQNNDDFVRYLLTKDQTEVIYIESKTGLSLDVKDISSNGYVNLIDKNNNVQTLSPSNVTQNKSTREIKYNSVIFVFKSEYKEMIKDSPNLFSRFVLLRTDKDKLGEYLNLSTLEVFWQNINNMEKLEFDPEIGEPLIDTDEFKEIKISSIHLVKDSSVTLDSSLLINYSIRLKIEREIDERKVLVRDTIDDYEFECYKSSLKFYDNFYFFNKHKFISSMINEAFMRTCYIYNEEYRNEYPEQSDLNNEFHFLTDCVGDKVFIDKQTRNIKYIKSSDLTEKPFEIIHEEDKKIELGVREIVSLEDMYNTSSKLFFVEALDYQFSYLNKPFETEQIALKYKMDCQTLTSGQFSIIKDFVSRSYNIYEIQRKVALSKLNNKDRSLFQLLPEDLQ